MSESNRGIRSHDKVNGVRSLCRAPQDSLDTRTSGGAFNGYQFSYRVVGEITSRRHVIEHLENVGATSGWLMRLNRDQEDDVSLLGLLDTFVHRMYEIVHKRENDWPEELYEKFSMVTNIVVSVLDVAVADKIIWRDRDGKDMKFSVNTANTVMNIQYPLVSWWKLIWFSQCIPKHSFRDALFSLYSVSMMFS
nr:hypothetical protein [Tanacetum cinerariifolium]